MSSGIDSMAEPLTITVKAARVGIDFAGKYYAAMRTDPLYAEKFYDDYGDYQTVFEDRTVVVARTRLEVREVLLRSVSKSDLNVRSIFSVPCGGSLDRLLVTVIGECFTHVFVAEYRPKRALNYVIVASLTRRIFAGPAADRPTPSTNFAAGDCHADTGAEHAPTVGLKRKKQVQYSPIVADIASKNLLLEILNHIFTHIPPPEIQTPHNSPTPNFTTENVPLRILNHILLNISPPVIKPSSPNYANGNIQPNFDEKNPPVTTLNCVPNPTEVSTSRETLPDTVTDNVQPKIAAENLLLVILNHIFTHIPPPEIQTPHNSPSPNFATKNVPLRILNYILLNISPPAIKPSFPNYANGNIQPNLAKKNPPVTTLMCVPNPIEVSIFHKLPSPNTFTAYIRRDFATKIPLAGILSNVLNSAKIATLLRPFQKSVNYQVPFGVFHPMGIVPIPLGPLFIGPNFPFSVSGGLHQQWKNLPYWAALITRGHRQYVTAEIHQNNVTKNLKT